MNGLRMKSHNAAGLLISFCGLDGCGKSTLIKMLQEQLEEQGKRVELTKQPTDFVRKADIFRTYMDSEDHSKYDYRALSLFAAADRIQHSNRVIMPALMQGAIVLSDRYFYSCIANLRARGYMEDGWIYEISEAIPRPDIAFFLDVPVETAIARVRARPEERERYIDEALQHRLRTEYRKICNMNGGILLDTTQSPRQTLAEAWRFVKQKMEEEKTNYETKSN